MVDKFLTKYFPPTKNADVREEIISFRQRENETVNEVWERFKELMRSCPNVGIPACVQIEHFYRDCDIPTKMMLNTTANGKFTSKTYNEIITILDQLTEHNYLWCSERSRTQPKTIDRAGVFNLDAMSSMQSQLDTLMQMMKNMQGNNVAPTPTSTNTNLAPVYHMIESICYYCGDSHNSENCPSNPTCLCYVGQGSSNNAGQVQNQQYKTYNRPGVLVLPPPPQQHNQQKNASQPVQFTMSCMESMMKECMTSMMKEFTIRNDTAMQEFTTRNDTAIRDYTSRNDAAMRNLEAQMGQLASELKNRPRGTLPSATEEPKIEGREHCKTITTRSGLAYEEPKMPREGSSCPTKEKETATEPDEPIEIEMPTYAKFLKDIITRKKKLGEYETVALTECSSNVFKSKMSPKLKDPGSFTIPCSIGGKDVGRALCDLRASINLMPLSIFKKLEIGKASPTTVTLQLADRSITKPEGKIEDVLVKVDKFIFPADFIILNCEADKDVPIILGRPFLSTGETLIDVKKGELTMHVDDQKVTFNMLDAMKYPDDMEECATISINKGLTCYELDDLLNAEIEAQLEEAEKEGIITTITLKKEKRKSIWPLKIEPP
ncbi:uncharacterized protein LOC111024449 [Momordica charantia]|uniref:Uncharacterized protein LOC111024449 n=1 Tax=Momordica charantia TaxID=3673 RepID=A0A6J1DZC3_MOMCH|nr:uncharacterized protein LOC111024449 [Momordica charantia]